MSSARKHPRALVTTEIPVSMVAAAVAASAAVSAPTSSSSSSASSAAASVSSAQAAGAQSSATGVPELRMLKLLDRQSGLCMFTEIWKWHPHAHAEGVDALVQSFTQFAREIDGGGAFSASRYCVGGSV